MNTNFRSRDLSWITIVLAVATLITFFMVANPDMSRPIPMMGGSMEFGAPSMPTRDMSDMSVTPDSYPYPYPGSTPDAGDTREFLKTNYSAGMLTRDLSRLAGRVATAVRGHGGRIDQESVSPKYGYVSFVVPMSRYEAFRPELESRVGSRFLQVSITSENLLPQKQSIEEQQKQADSALADYKAARVRLVAAHTSRIAALQAQIAANPTPSDLASLEVQLANENAAYQSRLANADANIKYAQDWQKAVATQDKALLDNLATVQGTVSLHWISVWELVQLYLPGYSIPGIFAVLTLLSLYRDRRRVARV